MKTRQRISAARRLYVGGCVLALLVMAASAVAIDIAPSGGLSYEVAALERMSIARPYYPGGYSPYGGSYGSGSTGPLVVDAAKAELKTDPEQERDLVRAEEFARQGKFELAIGFWQRVLDASTASVMTRDEWKFQGKKHIFQKFSSIADEVERSIARLPKRGLKVYRLQKDGDAQAVLAAGVGERREEALSNVVRKYFLSSIGDDAAFELACRSMDRGEFIAAGRLLQKILDGYPDPSVSRGEILLRLAVAHSRLGDRRSAEAALAELRKDPPRGSRQLLAVIEADVRSAGKFVSVDGPESSTSWPMSLGGTSRTGHMKAPAGLKSNSNLTEFWSHEIDLGFTKTAVKTSSSGGTRPRAPGTTAGILVKEISGGIAGGSGMVSYKSIVPYGGPQPPGSTAVQAAGGIEELIARWKQQGWMPAGQVLLDGRRLYVKTRTNLICLDAETKQVVWKSVVHNQFELDGMTRKFAQVQMLRNAGLPQHSLDVQLFGDLIHHSMSLAGDLVLSIEGEPIGVEKKAGAGKPAVPMHHYGPQVVHRQRDNALTAYDARTGKLRWTRRAGEATKDETGSEVGFLSAPVPYARLLLAPVINSGEMWLYGLDRETGKTVWKTNLCDEPSNGAAPWSPVGIAIDGGEAYVATGAGVVFALDAMSGGVRWAVRYPRAGRANANFPQYGYYGGAPTQILNMEGFHEDVVIPSGKTLIVMASDYDRIFALDRRSGEFLWDTPAAANHDEDPDKQSAAEKQADMARYCLGVYGDSFYVGSNRLIRRYKIRGGGLVWEKKLENTTGNTPPSLGRGIVTEEAVFVPVKDSVLKLSQADGKELDQFGVVLRDHQPVGNLYSDGQRLFVLGPGQVSALGDITVRLQTLDKRIEAGDLDGLLERMDIRGRTKNLKGALDDLQAVLVRMKREKRPADIPSVLLKALAGMELPALDPVTTLRILTTEQNAFAIQPGVDAKEVKDRIRARDVLVRSALLRLLKKPESGSVEAILRGGALYGPADLFDVARQAIRKHAGDDDLTALTAAMTGPTPGRRLAVMGLSRLKQKSVNGVLKKGLADADETLRLEAALVLCNRGERDGLPVMADLLNSETPTTRTRTVSYLRRMTGKTFGYLAYETPAKRAEAVRKWREWVTSEGKSASLRPVSPVSVFFGRTLIASQGGNVVEEYDESGRLTHRLAVKGPFAVQGLPNGHRLIASGTERAVIDYDESWKEVGRISTAKYGMPYSVQRLENGNTLVACYGSTTSFGPGTTSQGNVLEFDPKGEIKWRFQFAGMITHAERLENGNTLVSVFRTHPTRRLPTTRRPSGLSGRVSATVGKVLEVDPSRKVVRQIRSAQYPWSATRLANGNTLIVDLNRSQVVEVDRNDRIVWSKIVLSNSRTAQRLSNGNTLVTHYNGVTEFDTDGKLVWNRSGTSIFAADRY
jgi:outer membrane protein assembly factor BamB